MYCIRQSRNFPKLETLELTSLSQPKNGLKEIYATKVLLNAWLWSSNFENTLSHSAPAKPLSNLKSDSM